MEAYEKGLENYSRKAGGNGQKSLLNLSGDHTAHINGDLKAVRKPQV